ncbi:MAG: flagellar hook-associated protein FlgK [Planctomycetes bacterium]|nr:flagellar hook-associated protein FlgK [Planctomycetota bacterium]
MAGRALEVFSAGIQVAGQNVANANTPGYIREELELVPAAPYQSGKLIFGTGVQASGIEQQIDLFLETRLHAATSDAAAAAARDEIYKQLEIQLRELGDGDLSTSLSNFLGALNDVANQPESLGLRQLAVGAGGQFATDIASLRVRIDELRKSQTVRIDQLIDEANRSIDEIVSLNPQISQLEAAGLRQSDAGALRSRRYEALNRLAEIVPIQFRERKDGSIDVFTKSDYLILGGTRQHLEAVPKVDHGIQVQTVRLSKTGSNVGAAGGELAGLMEGRDAVLVGFIDQLDIYASAAIFEFNRIHSSGQGLDRYATTTSEAAITNTAAALNQAGLAFTPAHGSFQLRVTNAATGLTETTSIAVDLDGIGTETSLADLQAALNAINNVSAGITSTGRLQIDATAGYEFSFAADTSGALAALGINTFFTGGDSSDIGVSAAVTSNPDLFATGQGGGPADNRNALAMAEFAEGPLASLGGDSLNAYYNRIVSQVTQGSAGEATIAGGLADFRDSLQNQRDQFSGVSLDEEALKILEFQRSYQSAARLISVIDELFRTLLGV